MDTDRNLETLFFGGLTVVGVFHLVFNQGLSINFLWFTPIYFLAIYLILGLRWVKDNTLSFVYIFLVPLVLVATIALFGAAEDKYFELFLKNTAPGLLEYKLLLLPTVYLLFELVLWILVKIFPSIKLKLNDNPYNSRVLFLLTLLLLFPLLFGY